jgi:hypothetical protein
MRITPEILHKLARDTVAQRTRSDRDIIAVFLHGSLLREEPLLGGTADIDLFFIHSEAPLFAREITRVNDDVHLDISHVARMDYRQARELRRHPWIGPTIYGAKILYDPQHFMDFTQASVRGQFNDPSNVISRARGQAEHARQIWFGLQETESAALDSSANFLRAVLHAANSIASLSGAPLTNRRLLLDFPARAEAAGRPGLFNGLTGLLGGNGLDPETMRAWLPGWKAAFQAADADQRPAGLHLHRQHYYLKAFEEMLAGPQPVTALWPLLGTWTRLACLLPPGSPELSNWEEAAAQAGLAGESFPHRLTALDAFLDTIDETLEEWARKNGVN